jgi:hypothetical protein
VSVGSRAYTGWRLVTLTLVAVTVACGQGVASHRHTTRQDVAAGVSGTQISPQSLILATSLVDTPNPDQFGVPAGSKWMEVVFQREDPPTNAAEEWEGELLAQQARLTASTPGSAPVVGVTYISQAGDGTQEGLSGHALTTFAPQPAPSEATIAADVQKGVSAAGATLQSLSFEDHGEVGPVPVVVARLAPQAQPFPASAIGLGTTPILLQLVDSSGQLIESAGIVPAAGATFSWLDPKLGCLGNCPLRDPGATGGG